MTIKTRHLALFVTAVFVAGFAAGTFWPADTAVHAQAGAKVFELRTYTAPEGKLPNLEARFRDHTMGIFERHGMHNVGYWVPQDAPASDNTLIYIISHDSREQAAENWQNFRDDPEWAEVSRTSQVDGRIVSNVDAVFMEATEYSPMK